MQIRELPQKTVSNNDDWLILQSAEGETYKIKVIDFLAPIVIKNIAPDGTASASSYYSPSYLPNRATDGILTTDWASLSETNPWWRLDFSVSKKIRTIKISDRIGQSAKVNAGTLTFSDNSSINVTGILNNGTFSVIEFPEKLVTWIKFTITGGTGINVGLSEFQVFGY